MVGLNGGHGVLNVTPGSFHDGGEYYDVEAAVAQAEAMVEGGVDVVDVGRVSTRPGANPAPVAAEMDRIVPVVESVSDLERGRYVADAVVRGLTDGTGSGVRSAGGVPSLRRPPAEVSHVIEPGWSRHRI